ncbi:hypothetical protein [Flavobacterium dankookense]|uniref:Nuclear transport factor 2 family protein n=1 Tax=Flavobacterium dankookense TaxID=706186 RepID=A0A4V3CSR4_9FLAO|nr:hypothetical protein [Flavobacterium dankookense]TDP61711.1 hypothetical protein BC748_0125 [Flavobacterium dankookense]
MKKLILSILLLTQIAFAQEKKKIETYSFGQNGMELIAKSSKDVVIISTFNAKMTIREEIARKVYSLYAENKLETNKKYTISGNEASVTGNCVIRKKNNLIAIDFYYEKIEWYSGLIEIYKKFLG